MNPGCGSHPRHSVSCGWSSSEPLLKKPTWVTAELQPRHQAPAYAYAASNPNLYIDPTGLFVDWDVRDADVAAALLDIGLDPVLGPMMRRLWADRRNGVVIRRAQPESLLRERAGGFTSFPRRNARGGDTCDSNYDPEGHHLFVKGLGPTALTEDNVSALIAHEIGHAYYNIYGGDSQRGSIDSENRLRTGRSARIGAIPQIRRDSTRGHGDSRIAHRTGGVAVDLGILSGVEEHDRGGDGD
jgi:hypothetical protein